MKNLLASITTILALTALGTLALIALPRGGGLVPVAAAPITQSVAAAPDAANNYNVIALPLDSQDQFSDGGFTYDAAGLADLVGAGVQQVLRWNPTTSSYESYIPGLGGDNFTLQVGGVYWLELDSTAGTVVSFVGDVPAQGSVSNTLVRPASGACTYNDISIPLDQSGVTTPQQLADAIGNAEQIMQWNASTQSYLQYLPGLGGDDFPVKIGYPYTVCLLTGGSTTWP